jgi:hypothetical protein
MNSNIRPPSQCWISSNNFVVEFFRSILVSGQVKLIYSDRHNSKEIKWDISTTKFFSVSGKPPSCSVAKTAELRNIWEKLRNSCGEFYFLTAQLFLRIPWYPKISLLKFENFQLQKFVSSNHILQNFRGNGHLPASSAGPRCVMGRSRFREGLRNLVKWINVLNLLR